MAIPNVLRTILLLLAISTTARSAAQKADDTENQPLATIKLYNPTGWNGPMVTEIPVGNIATPGFIDWEEVQLVHNGQNVPFAIREGLPHWKAKLKAPVEEPRAEDVLVFSWAVPAETWTQIDIIPGKATSESAFSNESGKLTITYSRIKAVLDEATGALLQLDAFGKSLLEKPLSIVFHEGADENKQLIEPPLVKLSSYSSNSTMTELNFVLQVDKSLSVALTYRIHACGIVDILSDERPWEGLSPWLNHSATYTLAIKGKKKTLSHLVNRPPIYGFKDYEEVVKTPAVIHSYSGETVVELGEEFVNGRRWNRRLYVSGPHQTAQAEILAELADEGFIVKVHPYKLVWTENFATVVYPQNGAIAADVVTQALRTAGVETEAIVSSVPKAPHRSHSITLRLLKGSAAEGIAGDGFAIRPVSDDGSKVELAARTLFGLMQGALCVADHLQANPQPLSIPLVAQNPSVHLRAGGFGGGDFEVDFPFESDEQWEHALDGMIHSGMNVMADLSMWSNWRMTVSYKYMPEIRSDSPDALDELTRTKFSEIDTHREHALKLLDYLHERGAEVWQWIPIGAVPTTFAEVHPEAMCPTVDPSASKGFSGKNVTPCHTHPLYRKFIQAYVQELIETYPIDGVVMVRDDNGGICDCERCQKALSSSRTKDAVWEQYLFLYDLLRSLRFKGNVAVYPYYDLYEPKLDPLIPEDLLIVGHGSANALRVRHYDFVAPMGDTWLDNTFAGFRVAPSPRMKRLLADRPSFWIGGAYTGMEMPWESVGYFGWDTTATPNSLRYDWSARIFGTEHAMEAALLLRDYERLHEINSFPMHPRNWMQLDVGEQEALFQQGMREVQDFRKRLTALQQTVGISSHAKWFAHLDLFGTYFEYHLRRLTIFSQMHALVIDNQGTLDNPNGLPENLRKNLITMHKNVYDLAHTYDQEAARVPGNMMAATRREKMTQPFKEGVTGYDPALEYQIQVKQFAGSMEVKSNPLTTGQPLTLNVLLRNSGMIPWMPDVGMRIELSGELEKLGLPSKWNYQGDWMVFGDRRTIALQGKTPDEPGEALIKLEFISPFRGRHVFTTKEVNLTWK